MSIPKISVIIPVYGVEKYIEKCLESLFSNKIASQCEFLIINDCTRDSSITIAREILKRFPSIANNVKIIEHKHNMGLAAARNTGLKNSTGTYFITIDSDDWVEPNFLQELYIKISTENSDICSCDYFAEYSDNTKIIKKNFVNNPSKNLESLVKKNQVRSIWTNMIKKSLFEKQIEWTQGIDLGEDLLINIKLFLEATSFSHVAKPLYHYRLENTNSITHNKEKKIQQFYNLEKECSEVLCKANFSKLSLILKKDIKKSILGCCPKEERKKYYKLWPETKWVSDFYSKSLKTFVFFFFMRIKLYLFCNILIDLYQRRSTN
jgi:glycosyltransferase involved in cell wall biosynthesis